MKRTTISLPDDLASALEREARRRRVPVSQIAREALEDRLRSRKRGSHRFPFMALGASAHETTSEDVEKILRDKWSRDRDH
jgi:predicted transcriptional regulator